MQRWWEQNDSDPVFVADLLSFSKLVSFISMAAPAPRPSLSGDHCCQVQESISTFLKQWGSTSPPGAPAQVSKTTAHVLMSQQAPWPRSSRWSVLWVCLPQGTEFALEASSLETSWPVTFWAQKASYLLSLSSSPPLHPCSAFPQTLTLEYFQFLSLLSAAWLHQTPCLSQRSVSDFKTTHMGSLGSESLTGGFLGIGHSAPHSPHFSVYQSQPGIQKQSKAGQGIDAAFLAWPPLRHDRAL